MFQNKVVYQIYPKSFLDTDGNGVGDIRGIIKKLDYLSLLGVDMLWLTPVHVSPQVDNGYDTQDYYNIDPLFGTMGDIEELIAKAQEHNIEIMFDMVLNHTSTQHEWFQKALTGDQKYMDYYFFKERPTNWQSKFGGTAWSYVEDLKLYYLHLFDKTQADLNWDNDAVFEEVCKIVNFWLDKGIKGLRFDVVNLVSKPEIFEDDFEGDGRRFYTDGPHIHEYLHKLNINTFGKRKDILTVGEMSSTSLEDGVKYADPTRSELATIFNFHHLKVDYKDNKKWHVQSFDFIELKKILSDWQIASQDKDALVALFLNNHDQPRSVSRFGDVVNYHYESATMIASAIQNMRGIVYIYQGEEIGLPNAEFEALDTFKDVESINAYNLLEGTHEEKMFSLRSHSRDNGRTPMPWTKAGQHHGFTSGRPWLDLSHSKALISVEESLEDRNSIFYFYKKLIELRHTDAVINKGRISFLELDDPQLFVYTKEYENTKYLFLNNFYEKEVQYDIETKGAKIILSNYNMASVDSKVTLKAYETLVVKI
ncbi:MAG: alpha,alpha-phosphotrehalase [Erysipelothrix sp.]|nr:alpha,alpha-phosphotrehalase [Erysipelothrix sp.]